MTTGMDDIIRVENLVKVDNNRAFEMGFQQMYRHAACVTGMRVNAWRCGVGVWPRLLYVRLLGEMGSRASACMHRTKGASLL
jgi:hypothetical protein